MSTGTYLDDIDELERESEVVVADKRTKPLYPDDPERTRQTYEIVRAYKAERRALASKDDIADDAAAKAAATYDVIEPPSFLDDAAKAPGAAGTLARRLIAQGWTVEAVRKLEQVHPVLYVNDSKEGAAEQYRAGDTRFPGYRLEWVWMRAARRNAEGRIALAFLATWGVRENAGQKFRGAETFDPILGREWRKTSLKPRPPRDWEVEEGVDPPIGFDQWLALVAPKPPTKKRKKPEEPNPPTEPTKEKL